MSFLKGMFGSKDKQVRVLTHPQDLQTGDLVRFKLYAPQPLPGQLFEVKSINTYDYQSSSETEFVLRSPTNDTAFLTVAETDSGLSVQLSRRITREIVGQLFDLNEFANIFDVAPDQAGVSIKRQLNPDENASALADLSGWTANQYTRNEYAVRGYFYEGDYREKPIPSEPGDELDYFGLVSDDENFAVSIEVYDGSDEVSLIVLTDENIIEEMWPAEQTLEMTH
ncbi:MAG: hypothetical protein OEZ58_17005 [Gammaproteobacteria bacterium]|nr:hypothetical protein [Gammaproteobacteria bacterium]MDH5730690.1 hypothetical protein [Gammaproteobacteria bacterium]